MTEHVDVLIVAAGLSGIGAAHQLQTSLRARPTPSAASGRRAADPVGKYRETG
jgi:glycine/D-amino acid oxidase-like deaminating enzyme